MTPSSGSDTLVVPMNVVALLVGEDDQNGLDLGYGTKDFAQLAYDFSTLPYLDAGRNEVNAKANLSEDVVPVPFETTDTPLPPGAHVHWAVPAAIAYGTTDGTADVAFEPAPNRWLVVRIASTAVAAEPTTSLAAWVVESDRLWEPDGTLAATDPNTLSRAVPITPPTEPPNQAYTTMGLTTPLASWAEDASATYADQHTAVGFGITTFAAAYPHCPNVFGLWDPLLDLDTTTFPPGSTTLSYLVAGWYSDAGNDPLATLTYPAGADAAAKAEVVAAALGWVFPADPEGGFPTSTLCSGMVRAVPFDPSSTYVAPPPDTTLEVAVGNTVPEALAALLAAQQPAAEQSQVELVLDLLQLGLLPQLTKTNGLSLCDEKLHRQRFGSTVAGQSWVVTRQTPATAGTGQPVTVTSADLAAAAAGSNEPLPEALAQAVEALNALQAQYDDAEQAILASRGQIFVDWYKYMLIEYPGTGPPVTSPTSDQAYEYLRLEIGALNDAVTAAGSLQAAIAAAVGNLKPQLGQDWVLSSIASPRFWQPTDPVVLLAGADVARVDRYGRNGQQGFPFTLSTRLAGTVVSSIAVPSLDATIGAADLPQLDLGATPWPDELAALLAEAMLVDTDQAPLLACLLAAKTTSPAPSAQQVADAQQELVAGEPTGTFAFTGAPPDPLALTAWSQPWIPLMLEWQIGYVSGPGWDESTSTYEPDTLTANYELEGDGCDLTPLTPISSTGATPDAYQGSVLVTQNTEVSIAAQISAYLATYPDDPDAAELEAVLGSFPLSALAQTLSGFNEALLMRKQTLQLPVFDPLAILDSFMRSEFINTTVAGAVGDCNDLAALPWNPFHPLRGGIATIQALRLVDAFGQVRELTAPNVVRAASMIPVGDPQPDDLWMPPRFSQPARLLLRWLSATDDQVETSTDPASSPICGWLLFNHLDDSLMVYDASGDALGSLNTVGPLWQGAPGDPSTFGAPIETALAGANPHLEAFALAVAASPDPVAYLQALLDAFDAATTSIVAAGSSADPGLAVLVGRPLALVRASLGLQLLGPPALDQSWAAFAATASGADGGSRADGDLPSVAVPVELGDPSDVTDGLVGYFVDDGTAGAYQTFYSPTAGTSSDGVVVPAFDQLTVDADPTSAPVLLGMVIDPQAAGVHATTGLLPRKQITVPPAMYAPALQHLAVTFPVTPALTALVNPAVPVPSEPGYAWSWVTVTLAGGSPQAASIPLTANPPGPGSLPQQVTEGWLALTPNPTLGS